MSALDLQGLYRAAAVSLYRTASTEDRAAAAAQEASLYFDAASHRQLAAEARHQATQFEALATQADYPWTCQSIASECRELVDRLTTKNLGAEE